MKKRRSLLRFVVPALAGLVLCHSASAQRALQKNPNTGALIEGFKSGANTIELSATGTLLFNSGFTLTGGSHLKSALSLNNVENTALSTWTGSANITTVGTIAGGEWNGSIIAPAYLGTGSSITTKYLRGDGTWQTISTGLTIGTTTISGASAGDLLTSDGTNLQKLTPGSGVATWLATPSSSNLASAVTGETGTGALVFGVNPVFGGSSGDYIALGSSGTRELRLSSNAFGLGSASWLLGMYDSGSLVSPGSVTVFWEAAVGIRGDALYYGDLTWNTSNLRIAREGNFHAFLREGANANRWSVANTYTSATNYEAAVLDWQTTANTLRIGSDVGSSGGTARDVDLIRGGVVKASLESGGFQIGTTGTAMASIKRTSVTLVAGTATVSDTDTTANSVVLMSVITPGGTVGHLDYDVSAGSSYTVNSSSASETSTVNITVIHFP